MRPNLIRNTWLVILAVLVLLLSIVVAIAAQPSDRLVNKKVIFVSGHKALGLDRTIDPLNEDWKPLRDYLVSKYSELTNDDFFFYSYSGRYHNNDYSNPDYMASDTCLGVKKATTLICLGKKVDYGQRVTYMDEIVQAVVNANPGAEIDVIGHSLGGVINTYWAATTTKPELLESVNSIITLDSPLQGAGGACWPLRLVRIIPADITAEIISSILKAPILTISNPYDVVIPPQSSVLAGSWSKFSHASGIDSCWDPGSAHTMVKKDPVVWQRIEYALRAGKILDPTTEKKLFVGSFNKPLSGMVNLALPTFTFLKAPAHQVQVDSQVANLAITNFDDRGVTHLKTSFPTQPSDGDYNLKVINDSPDDRWDFTDTETQAIRYGPGVGNVDVVLVLDRSGSMSGQKIADAKNAAKLFVDLMTTGDKIGVVSFSSSATVNFGLTTIASVKDDAKNAIDTITAGGNTSIGTGLQKGGDELTNKGDPTHPWAIVLLSNGQQNTAPWVADILPGIKAAGIVVYTVGLGASVNQPLLEDIAKQTGGAYFFAPSSQDLQTIYNLISGAITGQQTLFSGGGKVQQGFTDEQQATIDSTVSEATFSLGWGGSDLDLTLETPSASVIDPAAAADDPDIEFVSSKTYEFYRIMSPEIGEWAMRISGTLVDPPGPEEYTARVAVRTDLTVELYFGNQAAYFAYDPIQVVLALSDFQPILGASVIATIKAPTGAPSTLPLLDDGQHEDGTADDGIYANTFTDTSMDGSYQFVVQAEGTSNNAEMFTRSIEESVFVGQQTNTPADLFITMNGPSQSLVESTLSYDVSYGNNGPTSAVDVSIMDILPEGVSYVGDTLGNGQLIPGIGISWTLGVLNPGEQGAFTLDVSISPTATVGVTIENEVSMFDDADDGSIDPDTTDNFATVNTLVAAQTCSITGKVSLQGRSNHSGDTIRIDGVSVATTANDGRFTVEDLDTGVHIVTASHLGYLSSKDNSVPCPAGQATQMPETTLLGGDTNNDKDINLFDLAKVGAAYGSCTGDGWFRPEADINETGCVDILDLVLVGTNYGRTGPTGWPTQLTSASALSAFTGEPNYQPDLERPFMRKLADAKLWGLQVNDVSNLYGIDVTITFDPTLVKVVDADPGRAGVQIMPGPLFAQRKYFIAKNLVTVDEKAGVGTIRFAATLLNPSEPIDAGGVVATIPVRLVGKPALTTPANFSVKDALLADKNGRPLLIKREGNAIRHPSGSRTRLSVVSR